MNCHDFEAIVLAIARGEMDVAREDGSSHTEVCERCAGRLAEERELIRCIRSAAAAIAEDEAPLRVEAAVLNAFRNRAAKVEVMPAPVQTPSRRWRDWRLAAAAAIILVLIPAIVMMVRRQFIAVQNREENVTSALPVEPADDKQIVPAGEPGGAVDSGSIMPLSTRTRERSQRRSAARRREIVTEFIFLREEVRVGPLYTVQVVRVQLSGSSLMAIGFPVQTENDKTVTADILVGHDGMARAIRFVE